MRVCHRLLLACALLLSVSGVAFAQLTPGPTSTVTYGTANLTTANIGTVNISGLFSLGVSGGILNICNLVNGVVTTCPATLNSAGNFAPLGTIYIQGGQALFFGGGSFVQLKSPADALFNVSNSANTFGIQVNGGTAAPTLTTCGTGAVTAGSRNAAGEGTATGATVCTVTFGAPAWTNAPFCVVTDETAAHTLFVSGTTTLAFTVNGLTAADLFTWICLGRI